MKRVISVLASFALFGALGLACSSTPPAPAERVAKSSDALDSPGPCGQTCTGACGPNCNDCRSSVTSQTCQLDGSGHMTGYQTTLTHYNCDTAAPCRQHDGCLDTCALNSNCSWSQSMCTLQCDADIVNEYGAVFAALWAVDLGPTDGTLNFDYQTTTYNPSTCSCHPTVCPNNNYTFDNNACTCVCNPQTCSGNYVFNQAACGCVCTVTSCPTNYAWDDNSCSCLCNPSQQAVSDCTAGGGTFNSTNCSCVTSTVCFSTGCQAGWCGAQTDNCGLPIDCGPCGGGGGGGGGGGCTNSGESCSSSGDCCSGICDGTSCIAVE